MEGLRFGPAACIAASWIDWWPRTSQPRGDGEVLTPDQREYVSALVERGYLWRVAVQQPWFQQTGCHRILEPAGLCLLLDAAWRLSRRVITRSG